MSKEIQKQEIEMNPEMQQEAAKLRRIFINKTEDRSDFFQHAKDWHRGYRINPDGKKIYLKSGVYILDVLLPDISTGFKLDRAERRAERHFHDNQETYQTQALVEAKDAGVNVEGWSLEPSPNDKQNTSSAPIPSSVEHPDNIK